MQIPNKIGIIDSLKTTETRLRFSDWEGVDSRQQIRYLAQKINELIDFLYALPEIPNEFESNKLTNENGVAVHEHDNQLLFRNANRGYYKCRSCGETSEKIIT